MRLAMDVEKYFLRHVLGFSAIAQDVDGDAIDQPSKALDQRLEGAIVAIMNASDEVDVGRTVCAAPMSLSNAAAHQSGPFGGNVYRRVYIIVMTLIDGSSEVGSAVHNRVCRVVKQLLENRV